jgi:hypothetical protein
MCFSSIENLEEKQSGEIGKQKGKVKGTGYRNTAEQKGK